MKPFVVSPWRGFVGIYALACLALIISSCNPGNGSNNQPIKAAFTPPPYTPVPTPTGPLQPQPLGVEQFRKAYGIDSLIKQGITGKGQTIIDIVSYGSPTLQQDVANFDRHFALPAANIQVISPLGTVPFDPTNGDMTGWAGETELDVEIMHAVAPDAKIIVLTSPVAETEGTVGLPQFRQLLQYALDHHLGSIVSMSWGASEPSLSDGAGRAEVAQWDKLFQQSTTGQGITYLASSGDLGATDYLDAQHDISPHRAIGFPSDDPWVTSVGGTSMTTDGVHFRETAWNSNDASGSNGGFSTFFPTPSYQQAVSSNSPNPFNNERGVPDVAADADPATGLYVDIGGSFTGAGGTSASAPVWAGIVALGNQLAGHNLGFIDPALYRVAGSSNGGRDFHDVTVGDNTINRDGIDVPGFSAGPGWDPVTGLGTPNAQYLLPELIAAEQQGA